MSDVSNRSALTGGVDGGDDRATQPGQPQVIRRDLPYRPSPTRRPIPSPRPRRGAVPLDDRVLVPGAALEASRARPGEQLAEVFEEAVDHHPDAVAVDTGDATLTYRDLDGRTNRLARHLRGRGTGPGDVVGLLLDDPVESYTAMLAVLKTGATFVPMDAGFPADRVAFILSDSAAGLLLVTDSALAKVGDPVRGDVEILSVTGAAAADIAACSDERLGSDSRRAPGREHPAYLIYTSGSTGRPKGVVIGHPAICNFVRVAADEYGVRADDRMYQGLTLAFDFSVEEIWTSFLTGATLVPKPAGVSLVGEDLHDFLIERRVTAMCVVPTLLATVEADLDDLRFLLVSGEACPQDLIRRWWTPQRRFLNVYGPTEATVTATMAQVHPDRPVTIGRPLPTYAALVLDTTDPTRVLPFGETGELAVAGVGLADGYLNRDEKTAEVFVPAPVDLPNNPSGLIYRTGDLTRINADGEIEYRGRIDLQVKIRGYRIELSEIEAVLQDHPSVAMAVVDTFEPTPGTKELVGYYSLVRGAEPPTDLRARLQDRLPSYMVPAYLEHLELIPMTTSDKADRKNLPAPTGSRVAATGPVVGPATDVERGLVAELATALRVEPAEISVEADFFDELGATSLLLAGFAAAVRRRDDLPSVSARDVYRHPTVRRLAAALGDVVPTVAAEPVEPVRARPVAHALTGIAQLLFLLASGFAAAAVLVLGYRWISTAPDAVSLTGRAALWTAGVLVAVVLLPVLAKWTLVGRFRERTVPLWGAAHLRFWVVSTLIRTNPMALAVGTPLYTAWLRLLGARIGRGSALFGAVPVATDLVRVGARTIVHPEASLQGYRAVPGALEFGPVGVGDDCVVGEAAVLDIRTWMQDGSQLGHASALRPGVTVPAGEVWHGSPAGPSGSDYRGPDAVGAGRLRRVVYSAVFAGLSWAVATAVFALLVGLFARFAPQVAGLIGLTGADMGAHWWFFLIGAIAVVALVVAALLVGVLAVLTLPRLAALFVPVDRTFPLYGVRHVAQQIVTGVSNARFLVLLLGDSSFITGYLKGLGYDLDDLRQTGSNFGTQLRQESPRHARVGTGTIVSDGLRMMNTELSHDSFRIRPVRLGRDNFVGNDVHLPPDARIGDDVLLATKVMVPVDGPVRTGVGLLGSPPMEIPRTGAGPHPNHPATDEELARRLRSKNRYNASTLVVTVLLRALGVAVALVPLGISVALWPVWGLWALGPAVFLGPLLLMVWSALLERATLGFRGLQPRTASIYDRYFWFHERLWKLYVRPVLAGTPLLVWRNRLAGLRAGRRVFDDGAALPEKSLVSLGDDVVLNSGSVLQCHSLEDGRFESGRIRVGDGVAVGVRAFVHYSTDIGDGATLAADSFLMKGEQVAPGERWGGNPAEPEADDAPVPDHRAPAEPAVPVSVVPVLAQPFTEEVFLSRVQQYLELHDVAWATNASVAVLDTLARSLGADARDDLARHLPSGLRAQVPSLTGYGPGHGQHAVDD
ncbi:Pls/PosA family non-ribosomal peptide synthetase [Pseudonocardia alni]|uniref:Non-ribosomal peptide synthetase-like protein n=7 Tax=Actinomycetes TaxID=1760 RepID=A0AA44ZQF2_PSEA5|nr:Pls/PosA family non-ribosomal peptide synthetase [Pseudonocardia alni]PKB31897.1 non-ribosomal peptide synthetase-like protein [Pseudonocardia alni]